MLISWHDPAVRLTGRWSRLREDPHDAHAFVNPSSRCAVTTAPGSSFELAFQGSMSVLRFDLGYLAQPFPHLWIRVDGGARVEAPVDRYLRVMAEGDGQHIVQVVYKGGIEMLPRWQAPLLGAVSFLGAEAQAPGTLPPENRKIIEFLGDSITEGVLADADYDAHAPNLIDQFNRPYQDDVCATYAYLTAEKLHLRPMFQAYGAMGVTRSGCGGVPRAGLLYPYVFDGVPYTGETPDMVVINHGTNDRAAGAEEFLLRYDELIALVRARAPKAPIVCLSPFCGAYHDELEAFLATRAAGCAPLYFLSTKGWVPPEPLHPLRDGHRQIAERLAPLLERLLATAPD